MYKSRAKPTAAIPHQVYTFNSISHKCDPYYFSLQLMFNIIMIITTLTKSIPFEPRI